MMKIGERLAQDQPVLSFVFFPPKEVFRCT